MAESHGTKRQAPAPSPNPSHTNYDLSGEDDCSIPGTATWVIQNGSYNKKPPSRRRRKAFEPKRRAEVAEVRKVGACRICRSRKVKCTHVLPQIKTESANEPTSTDQPYQFSFDPSSIVKTGDWTEGNTLSPVSTDVHDLLGSEFGGVPILTRRLDRIARDVTNFVSVINAPNSLGYSGPQGGLSAQGWPQGQPLMVNPLGQNYPESPAIPRGSNATYTSHVSLPALTSESAFDESEVRFPSVVLHWCNVLGCEDGAVGFADELDLKRHQESRHSQVFRSRNTYTCDASGCKVAPFMTEQDIFLHIEKFHPELLEQSNLLTQFEASNAPNGFSNACQADDSFLREAYNVPLDNYFDPFSSFSGAPVDQPLLAHRSRRQTVSSRATNPPRGRPQGLDGVNRKFTSRPNRSRSRSLKHTASENGERYPSANVRSLSTSMGMGAGFMESTLNIPFSMSVAAAGRGMDGLNEMELQSSWMQQHPEQDDMLLFPGTSYPQPLEMGGFPGGSQMPNMFQEDMSMPSRNGGEPRSPLVRNGYAAQTQLPSNVSWNREIDQFPTSLDSAIGISSGNLQYPMTVEDVQSYQEDINIQSFQPSEQYITHRPFRAYHDETYPEQELRLDIPNAPSQQPSNEDLLFNLHSRPTSIQTPVITVNGQAFDGTESALGLHIVPADSEFASQNPHGATMDQLYSRTSLSSSGANESLATPFETLNFYPLDRNKTSNNDYDNVSTISGFADLNMFDNQDYEHDVM